MDQEIHVKDKGETTKNQWKWNSSLLDSQVFYLVLSFNETFFVWIGDEHANFRSLDLALPSRQKGQEGNSTNIVGSPISLDSAGDTLANHLAKRFKCAFYVSYNIQSATPMLQQHIQQNVFTKFKAEILPGESPLLSK